MLDRIAAKGVRTILVESPDRFARDLTVQLTGHDFLKTLGVDLIPTTAPDFFNEDTPTAVLVRQVLGAIAQFEKTSLVAKLKAARERSGNLGGRESYLRRAPKWSLGETVAQRAHVAPQDFGRPVANVRAAVTTSASRGRCRAK